MRNATKAEMLDYIISELREDPELSTVTDKRLTRAVTTAIDEFITTSIYTDYLKSLVELTTAVAQVFKLKMLQ